MAVPFAPIAVWRNGQIRVQLAPLISNAIEKTYLSADMSVGTAMTVKSQKGFHATTNQPIIIGELGGEITELVESTTSSSPSTITLASASIFAHDAGTPVYLIKFNQIEFSHATTLKGSKSTLTASSGLYSIQPDKHEYILDETEFTSGFYFVRFKESVGGTFSDYSDGIEVGTWERNTVGYMIDRALKNLELKLSNKVTLWDCYEWINNGMSLIQGKLKRWPEHYSYNTILGSTSRGTNTLTMPTDAYDTETNKSIIGLRIGDENKLTYLDPPFFDTQMGNAKTTQVRTAASATDTTLDLDNSYDFTDTGSVNVYISGTKYNITYTGITRDNASGATAQLTGIPASGTGSITVTIPVDTNVWQDEREGIPEVFTVRNGAIEWYPLTDANEDNQNIYADYVKVATKVNSDRDTIDYQRFDMLQSYLTFRVKIKAKNNGDLDFNDGYFLEYREKLNDAIRTLGQNNKFRQRPSINRMMKRGGTGRADLQLLSIDDQ